MLRLIAIGAAAGGLLLAGCGGDDGDDSGTTGPSATQPSRSAIRALRRSS